MEEWMQLFRLCHAITGFGTWRIEWPDGRPLSEQEAATVMMFEIISEQLAAHEEQEAPRLG